MFDIDKVAINIKSFRILKKILKENPFLEEILYTANTAEEAVNEVKSWVESYFESNPLAYKYYKGEIRGQNALKKLNWQDYAAIRLMDYCVHSGRVFHDPNLKVQKKTINEPIKVLWLAAKYGTGGGTPAFFTDMLYLFRQFNGSLQQPGRNEEDVKEWMSRHPSGIDPQVIRIRQQNKDRIIRIFIDKIDKGIIKDSKYTFEKGLSFEEKYRLVSKWWNEHLFHLRFAIRDEELLNEMLNYSLSKEQMDIYKHARKKEIPVFINPYYLSLLNTRIHGFAAESDRTIRDYILLNRPLVHEFGKIVAWEKEDKVTPGVPNAAGYVLPEGNNIHRRYPDVAILIPDTVGRACGGLCVSCQRMYDFQRKHLNFDLNKLKPVKKWWERFETDLMDYFKNDPDLKDILITGGDALMSSDSSLERMLNTILEMAREKRRKIEEEGLPLSPMVRIRLGTRLPVYLPQRITPNLVRILRDFRNKAIEVGFRQFFIQTHFVSAMEITPESRDAVQKLLSSGWLVTNQVVFTTAASRRGHNSKLRQALNKIGVIPYYTFTVKGFQENKQNFSPNARSVQEMFEEKFVGKLSHKDYEEILEFFNRPEEIVSNLEKIKKDYNKPFLATDRNIMNLPGIGKSFTFRTIGITRYGKRILEFDFDHSRNHSPIINQMEKVVIIESKSISEYLEQLDELGENVSEYESIWGYSLAETETVCPLFQYPLMKKTKVRAEQK